MCLFKDSCILLFATIVYISDGSLNVRLVGCQMKSRYLIGIHFPMMHSSCTRVMDQGIVLRAL